MGVDPDMLFEALGDWGNVRLVARDFIECHLAWREYLEAECSAVDNGFIAGEEFGITSIEPESTNGLSLLRLKCRKHIPQWTYSAELPAYLILDFNGSASYASLEGEVDRLKSLHQETAIFIEQPFNSKVPAKFRSARTIYDTADYLNLLERGLVSSEDYAVIKFGRNSVIEFEQLRNAGAHVLFGAVLCTCQGLRAVRKANALWSNFLPSTYVDIRYRDGVPIDTLLSDSNEHSGLIKRIECSERPANDWSAHGGR